jgi:hypothetical protein
LASCWSSVSALPSTVEEKPHCGHLLDRGDHWEIAAGDLAVTQCRFDHAVSLLLADANVSFLVRIEEPFVLRRGDGSNEQRLDPEQRPPEGAPALALLDLAVRRIVAFKGGRLHLAFGNEWSVEVPPETAYEAWTLSGPDGLLVVSTPGGDLAIW